MSLQKKNDLQNIENSFFDSSKSKKRLEVKKKPTQKQTFVEILVLIN